MCVYIFVCMYKRWASKANDYRKKGTNNNNTTWHIVFLFFFFFFFGYLIIPYFSFSLVPSMFLALDFRFLQISSMWKGAKLLLWILENLKKKGWQVCFFPHLHLRHIILNIKAGSTLLQLASLIPINDSDPLTIHFSRS